ncbi:MAG TPA: glycine cleavage system aminomethyltransferase GcvT [Alphaproteobacteria bacterium]
MNAPAETLLRTPLHALHVALGARIVPFAGYEMPVQYDGIISEHTHTRTHAGLFDVSHMGQVALIGPDAAAALESLVPGDIAGLKPGRQRYTMFTNPRGGMLDDLMVTNAGDRLLLVINAACKADDIAHMTAAIGARCTVEPMPGRALIAVQGPEAAQAIARLAPGVETLGFMTAGAFTIGGARAWFSRSGYTGEDGFEISIDNRDAERVARLILDQPEVKPIGLGARDSLRLEAGLCLYGHDIDQNTTPMEADLAWTIGKRRREQGGFPGADVILRQLRNGPPKKRVGILPEGRAPAREQTEITDAQGRRIGTVTSGGYGPTLGGPLAMGYVETAHSAVGTPVNLVVRGTPRPGRIVALPFVPHRYKKG